jgi:hypothetical protein
MYDNVILHVVYEYDKDIIINNSIIPTLVLKNFIDKQFYSNWRKIAFSIKDIACEDLHKKIDTIFFNAMLHRCINERYIRKKNIIKKENKYADFQSVLYKLIAQSFGTKVNVIPFELLTNNISINYLKGFTNKKQKNILIKASGLNNNYNDNCEIISGRLNSTLYWKRKGLRPQSFPEKRLLQFAEFASNCDFKLLSELDDPLEAFRYIKNLIKKINSKKNVFISNKFIDNLFINALLVFYYYKIDINDESNNEKYFESVFSILETIPAENNNIIKKWNKVGIIPDNAYQSQALIELYNEFCCKKKCLNCQIGTKILCR